ncbi:MAG TPA: xanthine dehydrogenase family protein molybdopterin-binding subunit [Gaiellaceae bacterium]|nr:xanthine dehydrogenase family protein molybdopterin-binding subunit [Gaiellaceae bacterium]
MTASGMIGKLVGGSVERREDARILSGRSQYVDDVALPGMLHAAFVRSPLAHAEILSVDAEEARGLPGVVAVLLAQDLEGVAGVLDFDFAIDGHRPPPYPALSADKVRFVGDPVAIVIAESRYVAEDARDLVLVDYDELPVVTSATAGLAPDAPLVFEHLGDNVIHRDPPGSHRYGDVDGAFAAADRVVTATLHQHRHGLVPMETRGGIADYNRATDELTYYASTQTPHSYRMYLSQLIGVPQHRTRVLCKDVGGAFGLKWSIYREDVAIAAASKLLGRPVKWIEDRNENLTVSGSAREESLDVEFAVKEDGTILGIRVEMTMDHGAYPAMPPAPVFAALARATLLSALRVEAYSFHATIVATNKNPYVSYRGPGASETLVRERMMDIVARELGLDPVEVRRRNLLTAAEMPWKMPCGPTVHRAPGRETLDELMRHIDYEGFREEQRRAREEGRYLGLGLSNSIQPTPGFPDWWTAIGFPMEKDPARVRLEPDGHVTVITSQMPHGQGHETTLAQVAADELGVRFDDVSVVVGDTQSTEFYFFGTGASRAAHMASGAVLLTSRELKERILEVASHLLEARPEDLEIVDGAVRAKDAPTITKTLAEVATAFYLDRDNLPADAPRTLDVTQQYRPDDEGGGWAATTHACFVEVDVETGFVDIRRFVVVEDCGPMINPAIVEGQIRGGIAQGIGGMLLEHAAYDEEGQFLAGTFMTYLLPTAMEIPAVEIHHMELPTDAEIPYRGVGEGGAIIAPAAVANAVEDALEPFGVRVDTFPLTPTRILELVQAIDGAS